MVEFINESNPNNEPRHYERTRHGHYEAKPQEKKMTHEHSPMPWTATEAVHDDDGDLVDHASVIDADGHEIAYMHNFVEHADSNAKVMAAGPELLELVIKLALCLNAEDGYAHSGTHYIRNNRIEPKGSFIELVTQAEAAIAKATR